MVPAQPTQAQPTQQWKERPQRRWTVAEYHRMVTLGLLNAHDRVELIEGQILEMNPQELPHASIISSVGNDLVMKFAGKAWVRQRLPINLSDYSEPEPDIAIVKISPNRYRDRHPTSDEVYWVIEVATSTLNYDRNYKASIYAKANIPEYWVIDIHHQQVLVFRAPNGDRYQIEQVFTAQDTIAPMTFPAIAIVLADCCMPEI